MHTNFGYELRIAHKGMYIRFPFDDAAGTRRGTGRYWNGPRRTALKTNASQSAQESCHVCPLVHLILQYKLMVNPSKHIGTYIYIYIYIYIDL